MSFSELLKHESIGWDFDGSLHDCEFEHYSEFMHEFILAHPEKKHYIVTFRSHGHENYIWRDLAKYPKAPQEKHFEKIINCPNTIFENMHSQSYGKPRFITFDRLRPEERIYMEWKGKVCKEHGITVLVDDAPSMVYLGCQKYGIEFLDVRELI